MTAEHLRPLLDSERDAEKFYGAFPIRSVHQSGQRVHRPCCASIDGHGRERHIVVGGRHWRV